jgi:hypothetical protein
MSEENQQPDTPPAVDGRGVENPPPEPGGAEGAQEDKQQTLFDAEYVRKLRAEAAKYRTEAKQAAEKARQWDEHSEAQKSELEKAREAAQQAQAELQEARGEALRARVAASKGLPPALADRLRGTTEEEVEADADALLEAVTAKRQPPPGRRQTGAGVTGRTVDYENMSVPEIQKMIAEHRGGSFSARVG